ncbi:SUMO protease [Phytophthora palmivora]|uniref:SUMO protease n=1 Tax=Phytophthora palmivora TaxID=4796 RepID=A0A2P4Y9C0_9STRA|nr:SUMO protease [Phytophthora palmivora]
MARTKKTHIIMKKMEEEEKTRSRAMENVGDWDSGTEEQTHATAVPEAHEEDDKHEEKGGKLNEDEEKVEAEGADEEEKSADSDVEQDTSGRESATHTSGSEKRKRSSLRVEGDLHYVPVMKKKHASWENFDEYLKKYGKKYSTKMVIKETLSTELRNKRIMKQKQFIALEAVREATKTRVENVDELTDNNAEQVVVTIEGAGEFSETTLKSMDYLGNLVCTCGKSDQNVDGESEPLTVAKDIYSTWPHQPLIGFGFMVEWANLYCAREESWYNDVIIEAFGRTLQAKYCNNKTLFLPSVRLPDTNNKDRRVPQATRTALETATEDFVFMPINLNSSHWACIVVDNVRGRIHCYDSVDKRTHLRLLEDIAHEIQATALTGFTQVTQHSPTQKDSDSCGLFVCLYFWKRLWKEAESNYTNSGLRLKRWEILQSIVSFSKKQVADGVREMQI